MGNLPTPITRIEVFLDAIAKGGGGGSFSADDVSYDNTSSGLNATDVQAAIDELAQGSGGANYDISVSGTFSETGDFPSKTDILGASFTTSKTMNDLINKVEADGRLSIGGVLTKNHDSVPGIVINCGLEVENAYIVASSTIEAMASNLGITDYDKGDGVMLTVTDLMGHTPSTNVVIYLSTSGVKCKAVNMS